MLITLLCTPAYHQCHLLFTRMLLCTSSLCILSALCSSSVGNMLWWVGCRLHSHLSPDRIQCIYMHILLMQTGAVEDVWRALCTHLLPSSRPPGSLLLVSYTRDAYGTDQALKAAQVARPMRGCVMWQTCVLWQACTCKLSGRHPLPLLVRCLAFLCMNWRWLHVAVLALFDQ